MSRFLPIGYEMIKLKKAGAHTMKIETDMLTYERLHRCLSERFPDVKVQLITSDPMLKKLGFAEKVPCTIDVIATDDQAKQIMDDAIDIEVRAFMIDDKDSEEWKQYERYGWLYDFFLYYFGH